MEERDFAELTGFEDPVRWEALPLKERERLSQLFIWRAEAELQQRHDPTASLELAMRVSPENAWIVNSVGNFVLRQVPLNEKSLGTALACFQQAVQLKPNYAYGLWNWGVALSEQALMHEDVMLCQEAEDKFLAVDSTLLRSKRNQRNFWWDWANKWEISGALSGEAVDYRCAIEKFERAQAIDGEQPPAMLLDFARACMELTALLPDEQLWQRALSLYLDVVPYEDYAYRAWAGVGVALHSLFEVTGAEEHYVRSRDAYEAALILNEEFTEPKLNLSRLLVEAGEQLGRVELVEEGLGKLQEVVEAGEESSLMVQIMLKGLLAIGVLEDEIDAYRRAEGIAREALKHESDSSQLRCQLGFALRGQGQYFGEMTRFREAMEQFARALAANPSNVSAHLGMASCGCALGTAAREEAFLEKACRHLKRATELEPDSVDAWNCWALALAKRSEISDKGKYAFEAVDCLRQAIELEGGLAEAQDSLLLVNYGCALNFAASFSDDEALYREAVDVLQQAVERVPDDPNVYFQLALAWLHLGEQGADLDEFQQANGNFARAAQLDPEAEFVWHEWGLTLLRLAQLVEDPSVPQHATELRQQAAEKLMRSASLGRSEAYYHLAWCYCQAGELRPALDCLRKARSHGVLPPADHLMRDEGLAELRRDPAFEAFVAGL